MKKGHRTKKMRKGAEECEKDSESASARWSANDQARTSLPADYFVSEHYGQ